MERMGRPQIVTPSAMGEAYSRDLDRRIRALCHGGNAQVLLNAKNVSTGRLSKETSQEKPLRPRLNLDDDDHEAFWAADMHSSYSVDEDSCCGVLEISKHENPMSIDQNFHGGDAPIDCSPPIDLKSCEKKDWFEHGCDILSVSSTLDVVSVGTSSIAIETEAPSESSFNGWEMLDIRNFNSSQLRGLSYRDALVQKTNTMKRSSIAMKAALNISSRKKAKASHSNKPRKQTSMDESYEMDDLFEILRNQVKDVAGGKPDRKFKGNLHKKEHR